MINLHTVCHVPDAAPCALELISDKCYFVAALYQALTELVPVRLNSAEFREGEVRADEYAVFLIVMFNFGLFF